MVVGVFQQRWASVLRLVFVLAERYVDKPDETLLIDKAIIVRWRSLHVSGISPRSC